MEDSEKCPHHFHYRRGYGHGARSGGTEVTEVAAAGKWHVFDGRACKKFLGLFPSEKHMVTNPTEGDMKAIRHEALEQVMKSGAAEATVEIAIEYDKKTNILRATATGATELKMGDVAAKELSAAEIRQVALNSLKLAGQGRNGSRCRR